MSLDYDIDRTGRLDGTTKVDMKGDTPSGFNVMVTGHIESCQVWKLFELSMSFTVKSIDHLSAFMIHLDLHA